MTCIAGREVGITLRRRRAPLTVTRARLVIPCQWEKAALLAYCRAEHPECTVRLTDWGKVGTQEDAWTVRLWLPNPADFENYVRGVR